MRAASRRPRRELFRRLLIGGLILGRRVGLALFGLRLLLVAAAAGIGRQADEGDRRRGSNHQKLPHVILP